MEPTDYQRTRNQTDFVNVEAYGNNEPGFVQGDDTQGLYYSTQRASNYGNQEQTGFGEWERNSGGVKAVEATKETVETQQPEKHTATNDGNQTGSLKIGEPLQDVTPLCVYLHNRTAIIMEIEDTPTATADLIYQAVMNCEELGLNKQYAQVFALWMSSSLLELQLRPTDKPYEIRKCWQSLLKKYSHGSYNKQQRDEPMLMFQRNVFYPQNLEEKIKDQKILELLYEEARRNVLEGRYPCEVAHYIMLGGVQARIELGPYNPQVHSTHYFREEQSKYLPVHVRKSSTWTWLPISSKSSAEVRLLEQFKRIPTSATNRKLMRKYLEFCWSLPFYGSAFFEGQIEQPVHGLMTLMTQQDIPVLVAINSKGIYIIDDLDCTVLLGLKYEEFSWDFARPSKEDDPNCFPCLFVQFMAVENGTRVLKILQVFSRQASLMDTLISGFVRHIKCNGGEEADGQFATGDSESHAQITLSNSNHSTTPFPSLSNKLHKLTLATFDEDGRCIGEMGSWSFSY